MDLNFLSSGSSEVQRDSFNAAYSSLEQTIRNFSKERLTYEHTIEALKKQIAITKEHLQRLSSERQEQIGDYEKLVDIFEENEGVRVNLEATIATVERKLEILQATLDGYEKMENDLYGRTEALEEFSYCLKYRQIQLLRWIDDTKLANEKLQTELEAREKECDKLTMEANESAALTEKQSAENLQEKMRLLDDLENIKSAAKNEINRISEEKKKVVEMQSAAHLQEKMRLLDELEQVKTAAQVEIDRISEDRKEVEKQLMEARETIEEQRSLFSEEISAMKNQMHEITADHQLKESRVQAEKLALSGELEEIKNEQELTKLGFSRHRMQLEEDINALTQKIHENTATFNAKIAQLNGEKSDLSEAFNETKKQLEAINESLHKQISESEAEKAALNIVLQETNTAFGHTISELHNQNSLLSGNLDITKKQLEAEKESKDRQRLQFEEDAAAFRTQLQETVQSHECKLAQLQDEKLALSGEMEEAFKLLESIRLNMNEQHARFEEEKASLKKELEDTNEKIERQASEFGQEKASFLQELEDAKTAFDNLSIKSSEEKSLAQQQLEQVKTDFEAKESDLKEAIQSLENEMQKQSSNFQKEKADIQLSHITTFENLSQEYQKCKAELRSLFQKYQDQKKAIGKLVEETGVRPVTLPQSKNDSTRTLSRRSNSAAHSSKPEALNTSSPSIHKSPLIPVRNKNPIGLSTSRPSSDQVRSILKRPNQEYEKTKNVSFGPTQVSDFQISSSSDTDSFSPVEPEKNNNTWKRQKLADEKNDLMKENKSAGNEKDEDEEFDAYLNGKVPEPVPKPKRIRRIGPPKSPLL